MQVPVTSLQTVKGGRWKETEDKSRKLNNQQRTNWAMQKPETGSNDRKIQHPL